MKINFRKTIQAILVLVVTSLFISGCSTKIKTRFSSSNNNKNVRVTKDNNYNHFRYKPVIGTRQDDTKILIDMGQFAKIWIKNYRNKNATFVASHDIITMIREPGFIAGEDLPSSRRVSRSRNNTRKSFSFRSSDILTDRNSSVVDTNKEVKDYVNNYSKVKQFKKLDKKKQKKLNKFNTTIKKYLDERRD